MINKGSRDKVEITICEAITAIVCRESDENYTGDFSQSSVVSPRGNEFTTYAKLQDVAFVLERLDKDYGFGVDPSSRLEYVYQTPTEAEIASDDFESMDWFGDGKGGYFRWALDAELTAIDERMRWRSRWALQHELNAQYENTGGN